MLLRLSNLTPRVLQRLLSSQFALLGSFHPFSRSRNAGVFLVPTEDTPELASARGCRRSRVSRCGGGMGFFVPAENIPELTPARR